MIYVTGDTHGMKDIAKLQDPLLFLATERITKDDVLIICGDVAAIWNTGAHEAEAGQYDSRDRMVQDALISPPWTVLFVDGNHENFDALESLQVIERFGGQVHFVHHRLYHLMRCTGESCPYPRTSQHFRAAKLQVLNQWQFGQMHWNQKSSNSIFRMHS